jgi:hypothetical protein
MKTVAKLNADIEGIKQMMAQVDTEIISKKAQVEDLKKSNSKLVELSLGKERRPAALETQRRRIFTLTSEVEELKFVKGTLKEKLETATQSLHTASIRNRLEEYRKAEAYQLNLIQKAQDLLAKYINAISELEGSGNALELLVRINGDLNGKGLVDFDVDLEAVLKRFHRAILFHDFDSARIDRLNTTNRNLLNQLDAVHEGKRSYHKAQVQTGPTRQVKPHVNPLLEAQKYEQYRLKEADDLSKLLKHKKKVIHQTYR